MLGFGKKNKFEKQKLQAEQLEDPSKRNFMGTATAAALTTAIGVVAWKSVEDYDAKLKSDATIPTKPLEHPHTESPILKQETVEAAPKVESKRFEKMTAAYKEWWTMPYRSVFFVNNENVPVGKLVAFEEFDIPKIKKGVEERYNLTPGEMDENDILTGNLADEWIKYVRAKVAKKYGYDHPHDLHVRHNTEEVEQAYKNTEEPALHDAIIAKKIDTVEEIDGYFAGKSVPGFSSETLDSYVRKYISWDESGITPVMDAELRELIPCLMARESGFKDINNDNAHGMGQILSGTWKSIQGSEYGDTQPFTIQVEVIGKYVGQLYRELMSKEFRHYFVIIQSAFSSVEAFQKYFLVPCIINAYTAGAQTIKNALESFLNAHPIDHLVETEGAITNQDFFADFITYAHKKGGTFGDKSYSYTQMIYALRDVQQKGKKDESIEVASL